jgi:O-antigen/teichoic acid export membrane protein
MYRNVSAEASAKVFYFFTRFFIPPFVLGHVGIQSYGLYGTVFVLVSYFGMSAIGFSNAYVKYVAEFAAGSRNDASNRLLSSGFTMMSALAVVLYTCFAFSWGHVAEWIKVPPGLMPDARFLSLTIVGVFLAYLALSVFRDTLTGMQEIVLVQRVWMISVVLETILIFALLGSGMGLRGLGIAFAARMLFEVGASAYLCRRKVAWMRLKFMVPDKASLRLLAGYGGIVQMNSMMAIFLNSVERVIATPLIGLAASAVLDLGKRFPGMATSIPSSFASSILPSAADIHARATSPAEAKSQIASLYVSTTRSMNLVSSLLFAFLVFAAGPCLVFWLKSVPAGVVALTVIFALGTQTNMLTGTGTSVFKAIGRPQMELHNNLSYCVAVAIFVPLSYLLLGKWTVIGIAASCQIANAASSFWFLARGHKQLGVSLRTFWDEVFLPGLVPYAVGAAVLLPIAHWASSGGRVRAGAALAGFGALYIVVTLAVLLVFFAKSSERLAAIETAGKLADRLGIRGVEVRLARFLPQTAESVL